MKTRDARFWLVGGGAMALVLAAAAWLLLISPQRESAATLRGQAADAQVANAAVASRVAALARLNRDPGELTAELRAVLEALPSQSALPDFTRQVTAQAAAYHVTLSSIAVGAFTIPAATDPAAPDAAAPADPAAADAADAPTGSAGPDSITGLPADVVSIPVTLISNGPAADQLAFLHAIRTVGPRRALITSTQLSVPPTTGKLSIETAGTMTISLTVFAAVRSRADQAEYAKLLQG